MAPRCGHGTEIVIGHNHVRSTIVCPSYIGAGTGTGTGADTGTGAGADTDTGAGADTDTDTDSGMSGSVGQNS
jgi:hypothetical protein